MQLQANDFAGFNLYRVGRQFIDAGLGLCKFFRLTTLRQRCHAIRLSSNGTEMFS